MNVADWLAQQGGVQHIADPAPQAYQNANPNAAFQGGNPGMTPHGFFGNIAGLMSGGAMPGLQAWRARREVAGLPWHGHQQEPALPGQMPAQQAQPNTMFNAPGGATGSSYGGGIGFGESHGLQRSY